MSNECLVLVGSEIPKSYAGGYRNTAKPLGMVRGSVDLADDRYRVDVLAAVTDAEERLKADAVALGANVVTNLKVIEVQFDLREHLLLVGDAWKALHLKDEFPLPDRTGGINNT